MDDRPNSHRIESNRTAFSFVAAVVIVAVLAGVKVWQIWGQMMAASC